MKYEKLSISLPAEAVTQLIVLQDLLVRKGLRVSRSAVVASCICEVYEKIMIEENIKEE